MGISVFIVFLSLVISASAFEFTFATENLPKNEFKVKLYDFPAGNYDVKIFAHNSSDKSVPRSEIISLTDNNGVWQDSWNYVLSAIPGKEEFKLKLNNAEKDFDVCVRLRKSGDSSFKETCKASASSNTENSEKILLANNQNLNLKNSSEENLRLFLFCCFIAFFIFSIILFLFRKL